VIPVSLPILAERVLRTALVARGYRADRVPTTAGWMHVLHARGRGQFPPVLLLHGFSSAGVHFAPLMRRLRPHVRRLVAPDMPGHGFSDVPTGGLTPRTMTHGLRETLEQILVEPHVVFGNSMGGLAAIRMVQEQPDLVRALILASPTGAAMTRDEFASFRSTLEFRSRAHAAVFVDHVFGRRIRGRSLVAWGTERRFRSPALRNLLARSTIDNLLTAEQLAAIDVPILVIWGRRDGVLPPSCRAFYKEHLPAHAVFEEPETFGHSPYLDRPGAVAERVLAYLSELGPVTAARAA